MLTFLVREHITQNHLPSAGWGRPQFLSSVARITRRREGTLSACWAPNKALFMFPWSSGKRKKKSHSDPLNNPKRAIGRLDNGIAHWERAKGLSSLVTKQPKEKALFHAPAMPHAPIVAFFSTLNCVFTSIVANVSRPLEAGGSCFWHGWRADCQGLEGGTFPEEGALVLNTPVFSQSLEGKNAKTRPACCPNRLWLNLGWTFPHKTRYHIKYLKSGVLGEKQSFTCSTKKRFLDLIVTCSAHHTKVAGYKTELYK